MIKLILTSILVLCMLSTHAQTELSGKFNDGMTKMKAANYKAAIETFTNVLGAATDKRLQKYCHIYRGVCFREISNNNSALIDFNEPIEIDPTDLATYIDRGKLHRVLKNYAVAKKDFKYLLSKDSMSNQAQDALFHLGQIAYLEGKYELSISYFTKLLIIAPHDAEVYFNRASAKDMMMYPKESIVDYSKAIELNAGYKEAYANRGIAKINAQTIKGNLKLTKEQVDDACHDLRKAKELGDNSVDDQLFIHCGVK